MAKMFSLPSLYLVPFFSFGFSIDTDGTKERSSGYHVSTTADLSTESPTAPVSAETSYSLAEPVSHTHELDQAARQEARHQPPKATTTSGVSSEADLMSSDASPKLLSRARHLQGEQAATHLSMVYSPEHIGISSSTNV